MCEPPHLPWSTDIRDDVPDQICQVFLGCWAECGKTFSQDRREGTFDISQSSCWLTTSMWIEERPGPESTLSNWPCCSETNRWEVLRGEDSELQGQDQDSGGRLWKALYVCLDWAPKQKTRNPISIADYLYPYSYACPYRNWYLHIYPYLWIYLVWIHIKYQWNNKWKSIVGYSYSLGKVLDRAATSQVQDVIAEQLGVDKEKVTREARGGQQKIPFQGESGEQTSWLVRWVILEITRNNLIYQFPHGVSSRLQ